MDLREYEVDAKWVSLITKIGYKQKSTFWKTLLNSFLSWSVMGTHLIPTDIWQPTAKVFLNADNGRNNYVSPYFCRKFSGYSNFAGNIKNSLSIVGEPICGRFFGRTLLRSENNATHIVWYSESNWSRWTDWGSVSFFCFWLFTWQTREHPWSKPHGPVSNILSITANQNFSNWKSI